MTSADARDRVHAVLSVARRIADGRDALGLEARARLPETTGLSAEGVELALSRHLETNADDASLEALLASCGSAPRCRVVLSANVCIAACRALALAVATSPEVRVRPSRRDPVLAELFVRALAAERVSIACVRDLDARPGDEVHVYGRDETIAAIGRSLPEGARLRAHGAGFGVAVVGEGEPLDRSAERLARDVVPFDQRGCLSPRIALVDGGPERARLFASALSDALEALGRDVPRGRLADDELAAVAGYRATLEAVSEVRIGTAHLVGVDTTPRALVLPPAARIVHVAAVTHATVTALLEPFTRFVTAVGADADGPLVSALALLAPRARRSGLGAMQTPPLDGPVDRRGA